MTLESETRSTVGSERRTMLTRRNVVRTAAWSVPAVSVVTTAPAFAAYSGGALQIGSVSGSSSQFATAQTDFHYFNGSTYTTATKAATTINQPAKLDITIGGVTATGSGSDTVTLTITIDGQNTSGTVRGVGQYGATGSGWTLAGTPTIDAAKVVTFVFVSSAPITAGSAYPDLTFSVDNASTSGATVYAFTAGKTVTVTATSPSTTSTTKTGTTT